MCTGSAVERDLEEMHLIKWDVTAVSDVRGMEKVIRPGYWDYM